MAVNPRQQFCLDSANNYKSFAANLEALVLQAQTLQSRASKEGASNLLQNQQTAPIGPDGVISATPDGTPNTAHPIVALGISWTAYNGIDIAITQLLNLWNNQVVGQIDMKQYCLDIQTGK